MGRRPKDANADAAELSKAGGQSGEAAQIRDLDAELHHRLGLVNQVHSQSDIARKTGTSRGNVNRYLHGAKIPGEFVSALAHGLGVNPNWMIMGEGAPYLSDVTAATAKEAAGVLELVQAMNAVTRLKLGALAGKDHQKLLRDLNEALKTRDDLQAKLDHLVAPLFRKILDDMQVEFSNRRVKTTMQLYQAAEQLSSLCKMPELYDRFLKQKCLFLLYGKARTSDAEALAAAMEVLVRSLAPRGKANEETLHTGLYVVTILNGQSRHLEALRMARALLAIGSDFRHTDSFRDLRTALAFAHLNLGDVNRGGRFLTQAYASMNSALKNRGRSAYAMMRLLSGQADGMEILAADEEWLKSPNAMPTNYYAVPALITMAWLEDPAVLARGVKLYYAHISQDIEPPHPYVRQYLDGLTEVLAHREKSGAAIPKALAAKIQFEAPSSNEYYMYAIHASVAAAHLAWHVGDIARMRKLALAAEEGYSRLPPETSRLIFWNVIHQRNIVRLADANPRDAALAVWRDKAIAFFKQAIRKGALLYQPYAASLAPAQTSATSPR